MTTLGRREVAPAVNGTKVVPVDGSDLSRSAIRKLMLERAKAVLRTEAAGLQALADRLDDKICDLADHMLSANGMVIVTGVGKSRLVGEKISATLASTGTRSIALDPTDALHGGLGRVRSGDILLMLSNSGEARVLEELVRAVRAQHVVVALVTGRASSSLAQAADLVLDIGVMPEAGPLGLAPTTTTTVMMALGDALALVLKERRGMTREDFARLNPRSVGRELMQVRDLIWPVERLPLISSGATLGEALLEMCRPSRLPGLAVVVEGCSEFAGILNGDHVRQVLAHAAMPDFSMPVRPLIERPRRGIGEDAPLREAIRLFGDDSTEFLPVFGSRKRFAGLLARREVTSARRTGCE